MFEGTVCSLGRGTEAPFEIYGHPNYKGGAFEFTPRSVDGAKNPPLKDQKCYGVDLRGIEDEAIFAAGFNLEYVIDAYRNLNMGDKFFTSFFNLLIGTNKVKKMIIEGKSAEEIRATWQEDVEKFKKQRKPYLIYEL